MSRSSRCVSRVALLATGVLLLVTLAACTASGEPSESSVEEFETMLQTETVERWDGRVEFDSGEVVLERGESDMPPSEFEQYTYVATFNVAQTGGVFVVAFPVGESSERLRDWGLFGSSMGGSEAAALGAYSELHDIPPIMIEKDSGEAYGRDATETIWFFTQIDYDGVYLTGQEIALVEKPDGTYEVLDDPWAEQ